MMEGRIRGTTKGQVNKGGWRGIRKRESKETGIRKFILQMKIFPVEFSTDFTLALNTNSRLGSSSYL
jgi:hypothetical protein